MSVLMRVAAGLDSGSSITFVASATGTGNSSPVAVSKPTGTIDGDLMIAVATGSGAFLISPPAGWTTLFSNQSTIEYPAVFYKVAASEGSSYNFTGMNSNAAIVIATYRNASIGFCGALSANATTCVAPEVMIPTVGSLLLAFYSESNHSITFSTPSGMNVVVKNESATKPCYALFSQSMSSTGLTGTRTSTLSSAGYGIMFFLVPSSYVPPTPTFIASASTQNSSNSASLVISKPAGTVDGDLMVAVMAGGSGASSTWTGDTGWTEVADEGSAPYVRVAYKVASSEGSSYTFTNSATSPTLSGSILTYRGATYDAIGSFAFGAEPIVPTGPSAAANYCKLIGVAARASASNTYTAPASMTTRVTDNDGTSPSYVIADETVGYGATGTRSFSNGGVSSSSTGAVLFTIKPA